MVYGYSQNLKEEPMESNVQKLKDALKMCVHEMCNSCVASSEFSDHPCVNGCETLRIAKEALDLPLRNCDVGTLQEPYLF